MVFPVLPKAGNHLSAAIIFADRRFILPLISNPRLLCQTFAFGPLSCQPSLSCCSPADLEDRRQQEQGRVKAAVQTPLQDEKFYNLFGNTLRLIPLIKIGDDLTRGILSEP
ncbi:hypothetical protein BC938DRAFT_476542 [Jimgerdemannia flammicorona]|uniref:Uncharacterized protein n=1 Tax=Jimgerdemannia flammicorona TaxID=994334 RepID=A0A433QZ71_9FUNG|nr:hypothetical protein BC938DRAFT_476542 [Jimgerdemannia flammicorona]